MENLARPSLAFTVSDAKFLCDKIRLVSSVNRRGRRLGDAAARSLIYTRMESCGTLHNIFSLADEHTFIEMY